MLNFKAPYTVVKLSLRAFPVYFETANSSVTVDKVAT